jgi:transcriptional regulator with XRE-family HTH domain
MADHELSDPRSCGPIKWLTPAQCRAARGLVAWTQGQLAKKAGVSRSTVREFEKGRHELHRASAAVIRAAFQAAGIVLIEADGDLGPGVRLLNSWRPMTKGPMSAEASEK